MAGRLEGKVAIITGGGTQGEGIGNGKAVALLFAREGACVVVNDHDETAAQGTRAAIEREGGTASVCVGDLTDERVAVALTETAVEHYGRLDILHNNIGVNGLGTVVDATQELWDRVLAVNVKTMVLASKHAVPAMVASGGGSIVNVSSISSLRPRGLTPYSTSKGAVNALSQAMAIDHAAQGVRVNCIAPGPVFSPHAAGQGEGMSDERRERRRLSSPLHTEGTPWDIAYAALYLASDESRWITGLIMPVDGGVTLTSASR